MTPRSPVARTLLAIFAIIGALVVVSVAGMLLMHGGMMGVVVVLQELLDALKGMASGR